MNINTGETRDLKYVRPWRRYFAKSVDMTILTIGLGIVSGFFLGIFNPALLPTTFISTIVFGMVLLVLTCALEGAMISVFGTTFGKALFRTGVVDANGNRLGLLKSIARSLYCCAAGLGAGVPIVSLMTHVMGYMTLDSDGVTLWDKQLGAYVVHENMARMNWVLGIGFFILTFAVGIALNFAGAMNQLP